MRKSLSSVVPKTLLRTLLCTLFLTLPVGFAQGFYFGVSVGTPLSSDADDITDFAELGAQIGYDLSTVGFGVRLAAEGNPLNGGFKLASADALFRYYLPLSVTNFYTGIGLDALYAVQPNSLQALVDLQPVLHVLGGAELRLSNFGLFAEIVPSYLVGQDFADSSAYFVRLRGGVNVHF